MSWMSRRGGRAAGPAAVITLSLLFMAPAWGYEQYSQNGDATNCRACHGDFRASFYTEKGLDGGYWFDGLHVSHQNFVERECDTCHSASGRFPVLLDSSAGAPGLSPIACTGCHGRDADSILPGTPTVTLGAGAGLRQHHWNADNDHPTMNLKVCGDCHADADPAAFTPAGEAVLPTYYAEAGTAYPNLPVDPCDGSSPLEDQFGDTATGAADGRGTDNDGDRLYELADPDCTASAVAPGEAAGLGIAPLRVTSYDAVAGSMDLSYGVPCAATDHSLTWGNLSFQGTPTYDYVGEVCSIGATGTVTGWSYPAQSFFFLVVASDAASVEGSYGLSSSGVERAVDPGCGFAQDLANRCD